MMGIAAAAFGWAPPQFWDATPHEFFAAWEMWKAINGVKEGQGGD